jgi:hypothetical protein
MSKHADARDRTDAEALADISAVREPKGVQRQHMQRAMRGDAQYIAAVEDRLNGSGQQADG